MRLRSADFFLCRLAYRLSGVLKLFGDMETDYLRDRLDDIKLEQPVFITGLARSGTTILLTLFARLDLVGTHRYRDFPFLFTPYWWNWCNERLGQAVPPVERPHKDRIKINRDSPDAFEEPIWTHFFPFVHDPDALHILTPDHDNPQFDAFLKDHLRKILLLRGKQRYVSKGNYNLTRLPYIASMFPDARFVIPIRHPVDHVDSLVRQHRLFTAYSAEDKRVPDYLRAAGHFEFGPQRMPINVDSENAGRIIEAWEKQNDHLGYAIAWQAVYAHVVGIAARDAVLGRRIKFVRYEDLCAEPVAVVGKLLTFCGLAERAEGLLRSLPKISAPARGNDAPSVREVDAIWRETSKVAESFGYQRQGFTAYDAGAQ